MGQLGWIVQVEAGFIVNLFVYTMLCLDQHKLVHVNSAAAARCILLCCMYGLNAQLCTTEYVAAIQRATIGLCQSELDLKGRSIKYEKN